MLHSSSVPVVVPHCCPMMEGGPARTDPPSPRAALPTLARRGIWGGKDLKASLTARPGQAGLETLTPHTGERGRPGRPCGSRLPSPRPFSPHRLGGLHCNPAGPASSGVWGRWASTSLLWPPSSSSHRAAVATTKPPQGGAVFSLSICPAPQRAPAQNGNFGPGDAAALWSQRGHLWLPSERRLSVQKRWDKGTGFYLPATWALYCLYFFFFF